jgi:hypothetical protein
MYIAEHENYANKSRVQYDAWKLLAVEAKRRILVSYFGKGTEFKNFDELTKAVREVCADQPGKDILLIGGQADLKPTTIDAFRSAHDTMIVGLPPEN